MSKLRRFLNAGFKLTSQIETGKMIDVAKYNHTDKGKEMEQQIRRHIIFYGRVQGVAFRYRAVYGAKQLGLVGFVRNLSDRTVEMEVQGTQEGILELIDFLKRQELIRIDHMKTDEIALKEGELDFRILY